MVEQISCVPQPLSHQQWFGAVTRATCVPVPCRSATTPDVPADPVAVVALYWNRSDAAAVLDDAALTFLSRIMGVVSTCFSSLYRPLVSGRSIPGLVRFSSSCWLG